MTAPARRRRAGHARRPLAAAAPAPGPRTAAEAPAGVQAVIAGGLVIAALAFGLQMLTQRPERCNVEGSRPQGSFQVGDPWRTLGSEEVVTSASTPVLESGATDYAGPTYVQQVCHRTPGIFTR